MLGPGMIAFGVPYSVLFAGAAAYAQPRLLQSWGMVGAAVAGLAAMVWLLF